MGNLGFHGNVQVILYKITVLNIYKINIGVIIRAFFLRLFPRAYRVFPVIGSQSGVNEAIYRFIGLAHGVGGSVSGEGL